MKAAASAIAATGLCFALSACVSTAPVRPAASYPTTVADFERFDEFPATVAMYTRGRVTAYAAAFQDFSVAYDRADPLVQSALTVYLYACNADAKRQFAAERDQILATYPGSSVVAASREDVRVGDGRRSSDQVVFEFERAFAGKRQAVVSELLLANEGGRCLKVRTTAPAVQRQAALDGTRILLQGLRPR